MGADRRACLGPPPMSRSTINQPVFTHLAPWSSGARASPTICRNDPGRRESMEVQVESDDRRRSIGVDTVDLVDVEREQSEPIVVWLVLRSRTGTTVAGNAKVGPTLHRPGRHEVRSGVARIFWQRRGSSRNIEYHPMPEAASGRRVQIIEGEGEAFGCRGRVLPRERRRDVPAGATEDVGHLLLRNGAAVLDVRAR